VTPDSIPESPAEARPAQPSWKRNYTPPAEKEVKDELATVPALVKGKDLSNGDMKVIDTGSRPEKLQQNHPEGLNDIEPQRPIQPADTQENGSNISIKNQPIISPAHKHEREGHPLLATTKPSVSESDIKSGPAAQINVRDNDDKIAQTEKPFADDIVKPAMINNQIHKIQPMPEEPPRFIQDVAPLKYDDATVAGPKAGYDAQQKYPSLLPAEPIRTKYLSNISPPEETTVTINIGRIEVKAEPPAEPKRTKQKFSPALSLADYLKMRSEGRIG
jgi:hypothetical protein